MILCNHVLYTCTVYTHALVCTVHIEPVMCIATLVSTHYTHALVCTVHIEPVMCIATLVSTHYTHALVCTVHIEPVMCIATLVFTHYTVSLLVQCMQLTGYQTMSQTLALKLLSKVLT